MAKFSSPTRLLRSIEDDICSVETGSTSHLPLNSMYVIGSISKLTYLYSTIYRYNTIQTIEHYAIHMTNLVLVLFYDGT